MPWCIPLLSVSYTYQQGLITAIDRIQKECIAKYGKEVPEYIINEVIETGATLFYMIAEENQRWLSVPR